MPEGSAAEQPKYRNKSSQLLCWCFLLNKRKESFMKSRGSKSNKLRELTIGLEYSIMHLSFASRYTTQIKKILKETKQQHMLCDRSRKKIEINKPNAMKSLFKSDELGYLVLTKIGTRKFF